MFSGGIERDQWIILESIETNENIGLKWVNVLVSVAIYYWI